MFKRDLTSLNDEVLRYAEYCRYQIACLWQKVSTSSGKICYSSIYKKLKKIPLRRLNIDPKLAITTKTKLENDFKIAKLIYPISSSGEPIKYAFISSITSDEEKKLELEYTKKNIEKDDEYF